MYCVNGLRDRSLRGEGGGTSSVFPFCTFCRCRCRCWCRCLCERNPQLHHDRSCCDVHELGRGQTILLLSRCESECCRGSLSLSLPLSVMYFLVSFIQFIYFDRRTSYFRLWGAGENWGLKNVKAGATNFRPCRRTPQTG